MVEKFIQEAHIKKGALHNQLGISKSEKIPSSLLDKIINAKPGAIIVNPSSSGKKRIKVTRLLDRRALFARNLRNLRG